MLMDSPQDPLGEAAARRAEQGRRVSHSEGIYLFRHGLLGVRRDAEFEGAFADEIQASEAPMGSISPPGPKYSLKPGSAASP